MSMLNEIGIIFNIEDLGGGAYGAKAFEIFYKNLDPVKMNSFNIYDGDTNSTLYGNDYNYCIAVQSYDPEVIRYVEETMGKATDKGLAPLNSRFIHGNVTQKEPLVFSAHVKAHLDYSVVEVKSGGPPLWGLTDEVKDKWSDKIKTSDEEDNKTDEFNQTDTNDIKTDKNEDDSLKKELLEEFREVQSNINEKETSQKKSEEEIVIHNNTNQNTNSLSDNNTNYPQYDNAQNVQNNPIKGNDMNKKVLLGVIGILIVIILFAVIFTSGIFSSDSDYTTTTHSSSSYSSGNSANLKDSISINHVTFDDEKNTDYNWDYSYFVYADIYNIKDIPEDSYIETVFYNSSGDEVETSKIWIKELITDSTPTTISIEGIDVASAFINEKVDRIEVSLYDEDKNLLSKDDYVL